MKKLAMVFICLAFVFAFSTYAIAKNDKQGCTTIQSSEIFDTNGNVIGLGYDQWGYNYQAHMFNGLYDNYLRPETPVPEGDVNLEMKWSDEWLSNKDCNGDGNLDRGYSCDPENANNSACPGAWLTNHESGTYEEDGETCHYTYSCKIVTPPENAHVGVAADGEDPALWYDVDGTEIGPVIWGGFAIIQEVYNDSCGEHGVYYNSPASPGLGFYNP